MMDKNRSHGRVKLMGAIHSTKLEIADFGFDSPPNYLGMIISARLSSLLGISQIGYLVHAYQSLAVDWCFIAPGDIIGKWT